MRVLQKTTLPAPIIAIFVDMARFYTILSCAEANLYPKGEALKGIDVIGEYSTNVADAKQMCQA